MDFIYSFFLPFLDQFFGTHLLMMLNSYIIVVAQTRIKEWIISVGLVRLGHNGEEIDGRFARAGIYE